MASNYPKKVNDSVSKLEEAKVISPKVAAEFQNNGDREVLGPDLGDVSYPPIFTCILIDKSLSMASCKDDVIIAHREMINALRSSAVTRHKSHCISQYLFATDISSMGPATVLSPNENEDEVIILNDKNYIPDGSSTALYKSLYYVLQDILTLIQSAYDEGLSAKVTIGIITDGEDNEGGVDPVTIRTFIQELQGKKILRSSVVVGLKSSNGLNEQKLEGIKEQLGFDDAIPCDQSDPRSIREAFRMASQSMIARTQ